MLTEAQISLLQTAMERIDVDRDRLNLIPGHILGDSPYKIDGNVFRLLLSPCVYIFMQGYSVLYVGMSVRGLSRVSNPAHAQQEAIETCESVYFLPCRDEQDARTLESKLIRQLQPKFNIAGLAKIDA